MSNFPGALAPPPIVVNTFIDSADRPSSWSLRLEACGNDALMVCLYWGDKETATHRARVSLREFKQQVQDLQGY